MSLQGRAALVTGSPGGIGRAIALALAHEGVRVGLNGRKAGDLNVLAKEIQEQGGTAAVFPADVRRGDQVARTVRDVTSHFGRLDILVNNAGIARFVPIGETTDAIWDETLETNLKGSFLFCRAALPHLLRSEAGTIVNIGSIAAVRGFANSAAYCASKAGLRGFSQALREELKERGVRVVTIIPGAVDTPIWEKLGLNFDRSKMIPPADVAAAVVTACSSSGASNVSEIVIEPIGGDL